MMVRRYGKFAIRAKLFVLKKLKKEGIGCLGDSRQPIPIYYEAFSARECVYLLGSLKYQLSLFCRWLYRELLVVPLRSEIILATRSTPF